MPFIHLLFCLSLSTLAPGPNPSLLRPPALRSPALDSDDERLARKTRIVLPVVRAAFYRSGGRYLVGRKVYLQVESKILRRKPVQKPSPQGPVLIFENRSVPLVIRTRDRYWQKAQMHLNGAKAFSLRGILRVSKNDPRRRVHLYVTSIKRTPGTWR